MALSCGLRSLKNAYEEKLKTSPKGQLTSKTLKKIFLWLYNGTYDEAKKEWEALTHNKHPDVTWLKRKLAKKLTAVSNLVSILPRNIDAEDVPVDSSQNTIDFDGENGHEFLSRSRKKCEKVCTLTESQKDEPKHDLSGIDLISTLPGCIVDQKGKEDGVGKKYNLRFRNSKNRKAMHRRRAVVTRAKPASKFHNSFLSSSEDSDIDATNCDGRVQQPSRFHNSFLSSSEDSDTDATNLDGCGDSQVVVNPSQKTTVGESGYAILLMSKEKNKKVHTATKPLKEEFQHDSSGIDQGAKEDGVRKKYDLRLKSSKKGKPKHRRRALVARVPQVCRSQNSSLSSSEDSHAINVDAGDSPDVADPSQKTIDGENGYAFLSMSREKHKVCTLTKSLKDEFKYDSSGTDHKGKGRARKKYDLRNTKKGKPDRKRALVRAQQVHGCHNSTSSSEDSEDSDTSIVDVGDSPDVVDPSQKTIDGENGYAFLSISKEINKKVCTRTKPLKDQFQHDSSGIDQGAKEDRVSRKFDPRRRSSKKGKEPIRRKPRDLVKRAHQTRELRNKNISSSKGSDIPVDAINVHNGDSRDVFDSSQETNDGENDEVVLSLSKERAKKVHSSTPRKLPTVRNTSKASSTSHSVGKDKESRGDSSQETIDGESDQVVLSLSKERAKKVHSGTPRKLPTVRNASKASTSHSAGKDKESRGDSSQETIDGENDKVVLSLSKERAKKVHSSTPRKLPTVRNASIASTSHSAGKHKESRRNELVERGKQHGKPRHSAQNTSKQTRLGLRGDIGETSDTSDRETYHLGERYLSSEEHENQALTSGHKQVIDQVRQAKALCKDLSTATRNLKKIVNDPYQGFTTEDEDIVLEESDLRRGEATNPPYNRTSIDNAASKSKKWKPELDIR